MEERKIHERKKVRKKRVGCGSKRENERKVKTNLKIWEVEKREKEEAKKKSRYKK